jgi:hypothetical protein
MGLSGKKDGCPANAKRVIAHSQSYASRKVDCNFNRGAEAALPAP